MSDSILTSTKTSLGITEDYTVFDPVILMHINSVFSTLNQIGIGPVDGFEIADATPTWDSYLLENAKFNFIKTYMYLRVRLLFDPPSTSFHITALEKQIDELTWRISALREAGVWIPNVESSPELDGGNAVGGLVVTRITIRFRRDEASRWAEVNPVLAEGEPGFESDTGKFKIGDGDARWLDLEYFKPSNISLLPQDLQDHINAATPHPAYDDGPSLLLLYQNAKV